MTDTDWNDDGQLLEALRDTLTADQDMPRAFVDAGKAAFAWRTIDAELAALTYDSAWESLEPAPVRSAAESATLRALTFASEGWRIELELTPDGLLGQLDPPAAGEIVARTDADVLATARIDELGFFVLKPVPKVPYRLVCTPDDGPTILTGWVTP
ncbi:hypothetical protein HPO96_08190 [Kribbella sandramycini]|uniref:Uncharacterized protein n=1 Tax=Kribbella sandramycini TaxID=60450 RepID=A0A7Y4NY73_9ACTN|nr:hypothetical protein [Kribbella sandramycini]MBB6569955.1 hypothetical protein [Kribbella sandramycini]NOL40221.1 hypothetical protein [Kribbella sandramycini]